jgi:hypothetical protein
VTLVEFLLNAIADDEAVARASLNDATSYGAEDSSYEEFVNLGMGEGSRESAGVHAGRWDPARVLAEVESKRAIIARITEYERLNCTDDFSGEWMSEDILRLLALPYSDRPGYDMAWTP